MTRLVSSTRAMAGATLALGVVLSGCGTPPTPEQRMARYAGVSIHDHLRSAGNFKFAQDKQSNVVAYRSYKGMATGAFQQRRSGLRSFEDHCEANGGRLQFDDEGGAKARAGVSSAQGRALSTADLWMVQGIVSGDAAALNVFSQQLMAQQVARRANAFLFDSARRTESVGSFVCVDTASAAPKWWLFRELHNAHKGYASDGGMYRFPDAYSVYFNETVLVYEKQRFVAGTTGYAPLPRDSDDLVYPATGFHVVLESRGGAWQVVSAKPYRSGPGDHRQALALAPKRQNERQEIVIVSEDGRFAAPAYPDRGLRFEASDNDISRHRCHVDSIARRMVYSICTSAFTDKPREVGLTLKLLAPNPNASYNLQNSRTLAFQPDLFWRALDQARLQEAIRQVALTAAR